MKSFKQLMEEIREAKQLSPQPINESAQPHSGLYEIGVSAHANRILRGGEDIKPEDFPSGISWPGMKPTGKKLFQARRLRKIEKKETRLPKFSTINTRASADAQTLIDQLRQSHGLNSNSRVHWTPDPTSRKRLHPDETHSGDVVITGKKIAPDGTVQQHDAAINLKFGKGVSYPSPTHEEIMDDLHPEGSNSRAAAHRAFETITRLHRQGALQQRRHNAYSKLSQIHADGFNNLSPEQKMNFVKKLYGVSSSNQKQQSAKITQYTFHSGSSGAISNQEHFKKDFPENEEHEITAVLHGRGIHIERNGKRIGTLSYRGRATGKVEPNFKR